ncbi:MAG: UDP-N-acetylglucosamine 1-carboxyvinyltransferase [Firmicutes bacterium]|nr:UDP-N-acetylglucosamine 1-carboxyvinyltransferase [Bacillota bacterium]
MSKKIRVEGGNPLVGNLRIGGAKNACLPILAACALINGKTVINDVPKISDIEELLMVMSGLGAKIWWEGNKVHLDTSSIVLSEVKNEEAKKIRGSLLLLGSLIGRFKTARLPFPGGCKIGTRPIDLHISALKDMGIATKTGAGFIQCNTKKIKNASIYLDFPSVGATQNIILASVLGNAKIQISNAAKEPEVIDLVNFLKRCGACIVGEGTDTITIHGVKRLNGCEYTPIPDRVNTASYMIATAVTGGNVTLENVRPEHNFSLIKKLEKKGIDVSIQNNKVHIRADKRYKNLQTLQTSPWPGFSTDLQSQFAVLSTISKGDITITENLFENRFTCLDELRKFGARICIKGRTATINGTTSLGGGTQENPLKVKSSDLRGGVALVIAALVAKGTTIIENAELVYRGHEDIVKDLSALGANISLVD